MHAVLKAGYDFLPVLQGSSERSRPVISQSNEMAEIFQKCKTAQDKDAAEAFRNQILPL